MTALCTPVVLPEPCEDLQAKLELSDKSYLTAVGILKAAEFVVVGCADLGCFESQNIQFGVPDADPLCCNTLSVGIMAPTLERDGTCFFYEISEYELLISRCKPRIENGVLPADGDLTGCTAGSLSEHALYMSRHEEAIRKNLVSNLCCFLGPDWGKCSCCNGALLIDQITFDTAEFCDQIRVTIKQGE